MVDITGRETGIFMQVHFIMCKQFLKLSKNLHIEMDGDLLPKNMTSF